MPRCPCRRWRRHPGQCPRDGSASTAPESSSPEHGELLPRPRHGAELQLVTGRVRSADPQRERPGSGPVTSAHTASNGRSRSGSANRATHSIPGRHDDPAVGGRSRRPLRLELHPDHSPRGWTRDVTQRSQSAVSVADGERQDLPVGPTGVRRAGLRCPLISRRRTTVELAAVTRLPRAASSTPRRSSRSVTQRENGTWPPLDA